MKNCVDDIIGNVYKYKKGVWRLVGKIQNETVNETGNQEEGGTEHEESEDSELGAENETETSEAGTSDISSTQSCNCINEEFIEVLKEIRDDQIVIHQQIAGTHLFLGVLLGAFLIAKMFDRWKVKF